MIKRMYKKGLVAVVILIFLSLAVQPSMATVLPMKEKILQQQEEVEPSGLKWETYTTCEIYGVLAYEDEIHPFQRIFFAFIVIIDGIESCTLYGAKGEVEVDKLIGFGFIGYIYPAPIPRTTGLIDGHLLFCYYTKRVSSPIE